MPNDVETATQLLAKTNGSAEGVLKLVNEHGAVIRKKDLELYVRLVTFRTKYQDFLDDANTATGSMKATVEIAKITLGKDFAQAYKDCSVLRLDPNLKERARQLQIEAKALYHDCENAQVFSEFEWWKILLAALAGMGGLLLVVVTTPLSMGVGLIIVSGGVLGVAGLTTMAVYRTWRMTAEGNDILQKFIEELKIIEEQLKKIPDGLSDIERAKIECDIVAERYIQGNDELKEAFEAFLKEKIDNLLESIARVDELLAQGRGLE